MKKEIRKEAEIFAELAKLCASPGYLHALAYLCFRDNTINCAGTVTTDDLLTMFSKDRLVRTEITTLIGLTCKEHPSIELPPPDVVQNYIDITDALLKELHQSMMLSLPDTYSDKLSDKSFNPLQNNTVLRESIFYGGESAYQFQYRDFSKIKYTKDNDWFINNKGFSVQQAIDVVISMQALQNHKIHDLMQGLVDKTLSKWSHLSVYTFTPKEVSNISNIDINTVRLVIESFVAPSDTSSFDALDDFNPKNAYPIIQLAEDKYLLFLIYSLVEALYETPFFWFNSDTKYKSIAMRHRGEFTEQFSAERMKLVFGEERVFTNIDVYNSKNIVGEIDVLVVFANRAIILQAKSKKLTIAARKGNDNSLQDDFKKAVQDAYDQAYLCATFLNNSDFKLIDSTGNELIIHRQYKEIYPFCVVSDHYPALSFQAKQFLKYQETQNIKPPFVMDIFLLDVMTEILKSPLHFLSYVNRRTTYVENIFSTHELTILSFHLKQNLWVDGEDSIIYLEDDICADLDLAMLTRRDRVPGADTPEGILTKYKGTAFDQIIEDIGNKNHFATIDLGFMLLSLGGGAIEMINDGISHLIKLGKKDGLHHDLTLGAGEGVPGLTIHCNDDYIPISGQRLEKHCKIKKYALKANSWFGICIGIKNSRVRFGVNHDYEWVHSKKMDAIVKNLPKPQSIQGKNKINFTTVTRKSKKIGRNEQCSCGSGKKYKKCCLV